jgi:hypothetical protein
MQGKIIPLLHFTSYFLSSSPLNVYLGHETCYVRNLEVITYVNLEEKLF